MSKQVDTEQVDPGSYWLRKQQALEARVRELEIAATVFLDAIGDWQLSLWSLDPTAAEPPAAQRVKLAQERLAALLRTPAPEPQPEAPKLTAYAQRMVDEGRKT